MPRSMKKKVKREVEQKKEDEETKDLNRYLGKLD